MPKTSLNRTFNVGDRVCKKPTNTTITCANTPKQKPVRRGVIIARERKAQRSATSASGFAYRWHNQIQWDNGQSFDWVDDIRIIHESELETFLQSK